MSSFNTGLWACAAFLCSLPGLSNAEEIHIAVASNFRPVMERLVDVFEAGSGHDVLVSYGSTGKHYAQIVNGAPFELFLAADRERPQRLEDENLAIAGSRFTYAVGKLVLWAPHADVATNGEGFLRESNFRFMAIANPRIAPYGRAAEQFLRKLGVWEGLQSRLVRGENIAQAFAYVRSGNADVGLIALSQKYEISSDQDETFWIVPQEMYQPIEQQAVLLKNSPAAAGFLGFLRGQAAAKVIAEFGYALP